MIFSMTGYAIATRELIPATPSDGGQHPGSTSVSVELRSVNSRFLDLHFRMPDDVRACEPALREMLMAALSRGKVEIRINIQRAESVSSGGLDHAALAQLAALQEAALAAFPGAERLRVGEMLRWPGVMADSSVDGDVLRTAVLACGREALAELLEMRGREGQALGAVLREHVTAMETIVAGLAPLVPELVERHQQKIVERLREALGLALQDGGTPAIPRDEVTERIRQEVTVYGVRIDIAEELTRLATHLAETRHVLDKGGKLGKRLDFMMQELNREANTVGSKAAAKELADAAMALKLLIEQMREQVQNLE
ncbi:MAG: YicC/YloC family endoribonuclease [Janthinobacterium lividum]